MKLRFLLTFFLINAILFISCGSTPKQENSSDFNEIDNVDTDEHVILLDEEEDIIVVSDDVVSEESVEIITDDDEYIRSTNNLSDDEQVSHQEFTEDKATIMKIIEDLQEIMQKKDFNAWLKYIDPQSIKYYSNPVNVRKAQKKLPYKTIQLNGIEDYFVHVFISSRKRSEVKEIRYISKTETKAVNIKDDGSIVVYYQFIKINNKWLVRIPPL